MVTAAVIVFGKFILESNNGDAISPPIIQKKVKSKPAYCPPDLLGKNLLARYSIRPTINVLAAKPDALKCSTEFHILSNVSPLLIY